MKEKNKKRFESLYAKQSDAIYRFCLFRVSDKEKALEIMQECFLKFWVLLSENKKDINSDKTMLFTIARNMVIDWYRKKKAVSLEAMAEQDDGIVEILDDHFYADVSMQVEGKFALDKINELSPSYRSAVYLRFVEGIGPSEIAEIMGESSNSVSVKINRGINELRKKLGYQ